MPTAVEDQDVPCPGLWAIRTEHPFKVNKAVEALAHGSSKKECSAPSVQPKSPGQSGIVQIPVLLRQL